MKSIRQMWLHSNWAAETPSRERSQRGGADWWATVC